MKFRSYVFGAMCGLISVAAMAQQVPYTFQPGTPAQASQVNGNFQNLNSRVNKSIGGLIRIGVNAESDTGVASATCPADSLSASANCNCDYVNGTKDFGVLFFCQMSGNGGVAGCFDYPDTFLPHSRAKITLACLKVVLNDGTIPPSAPLSFTSGGSGAQKTQKEMDDELEATVKAVQDQRADYEASMKLVQPQAAETNHK